MEDDTDLRLEGIIHEKRGGEENCENQENIEDLSEHQNELRNQEELQNDDTGQSELQIVVPKVIVEDGQIEVGTRGTTRSIREKSKTTKMAHRLQDNFKCTASKCCG